MSKTFKELNNNLKIEKKVVKSGLSLSITFTKEDQKRYNIKYGSVIILDNAMILESKDI